MAWTQIPSAGSRWNSLAMRTQIVQSIRERLFALAPTFYGVDEWGDVAMPSAGDPAARAPGAGTVGQYWHINKAQEMVQILAPYFLTTPNVTGLALSAYEDLPFYTAASMWTAAGMDPAGWTRACPRLIQATSDYGEAGWRARWNGAASTGYTYYEHDGAAWLPADDQRSRPDRLTGHGVCRKHDYIRPQLFDELRACLDLLVYIAIPLSAGPVKYKEAYGYDTTWPAAKATCESEWSSGGAPADLSPPHIPYHGAEALTVGDGRFAASGGYPARAVRYAAKYDIHMRPADDLGHLTADVSVYLVAEAPSTGQYDIVTSTFDDNGDGVVEGQAVLIDSHVGADLGQDTIEASAYFPWGQSDVIPDWGSEPTTGDVEGAGYQERFAFAVLDCSGTFAYVADP